MQKIILFMGIMFMTYSSYSGNPPAAVQKAFNQQFSKATDVKWGKESTNEYEADFVLNGAKMSANYAADGTWLETETEIKADQLPAKISEFFTKTYPGWETVSASKVETVKKGIIYEANLKSGTKKKEVSVTPEGTQVK
jgi:hypothetical protein